MAVLDQLNFNFTLYGKTVKRGGKYQQSHVFELELGGLIICVIISRSETETRGYIMIRIVFNGTC